MPDHGVAINSSPHTRKIKSEFVVFVLALYPLIKTPGNLATRATYSQKKNKTSQEQKVPFNLFTRNLD